MWFYSSASKSRKNNTLPYPIFSIQLSHHLFNGVEWPTKISLLAYVLHGLKCLLVEAIWVRRVEWETATFVKS